MKKVGFILISILIFAICGCDFEPEEILRKSELEYITVDTTDSCVKTNYLIGEEFDSTGIKVVGHYSDGSSRIEDSRLVEYKDFDSSESCEVQYVNVYYKEKTTFFTVSVDKAVIERIFVISLPAKTFYLKGDVFNSTGLVVKAEYSNNTTRILSQDEYDISGFDSSDYRTCEIYVTLKSDLTKKDSFTVRIEDYDITKIYIDTEPTRKIYTFGESIDLTGLVVKAVITGDELPKTISSDLYCIEPADISTITSSDVDENGEVVITVRVNEQEAFFTIRFVEGYVNAFKIMGEIPSLYYEGDEFGLDSLQLVQLLSNGETRDAINLSEEDISYKYNDNTYRGDEKIKLSGTGSQKITILYDYTDISDGKTKTYEYVLDICVAESKLDHIVAVFNQENSSRVPLEGESPDYVFEQNYGTWEIKGVLKNTKEILIEANQCTFSYTYGIKPVIQVLSDPDAAVTGNITVTYKDVTQDKIFECNNVPITYGKPIVVDVEIYELPIKMTYFVGDVFDKTGLKYINYYSDGTNAEIKTEDGVFVPSNSFTEKDVGNSCKIELIFTASDIKKNIYVKVVEKLIDRLWLIPNADSELKFKRGLSDAAYNFKDFFTIKGYNKNGLEVTVYFDKVNCSLVDNSDDFLSTASGLLKVVLNEDNSITATYPVTVVPNITDISILWNSNKVTKDTVFYKHLQEDDDDVIENLYMKYFEYIIIGKNVEKKDEVKKGLKYADLLKYGIDVTRDGKTIKVSENKTLEIKDIQENTVNSVSIDYGNLKPNNTCIHYSPLNIETLSSVYDNREGLFDCKAIYNETFYDFSNEDILTNFLLYNCIHVQWKTGNSFNFIIKYEEKECNPIYYCIGGTNIETEKAKCEDKYVLLSSL